MSKSFHLFRHGLWLAVFLFSLLGSTQKCSAQFGLFDTVWTMKNQSILCKSKNDSLLFLYGSKDSSIYLVKTINPSDTVWWSTTYPNTSNPRKFLNNDAEILFDTWDRISNTKFYKIANLSTNEILDSVSYNPKNFPFQGCSKWFTGVSEVDTSIYYSGYCGATAIKGISYKVNYRTGQVKETSIILPYFAMTISEDGQYVAGVYYTGGGGTNVPYNEVIEVRKISDYSLVFRKESKYCDWKPSFTPYQWAMEYKFKFSKDNKYLLLSISSDFVIYNLQNKQIILSKNLESGVSRYNYTFTKDSKGLFYKKRTYPEGKEFLEYKLISLETLTETSFNFIEESQIYDGGYYGLILEDKYLLSSTTRICDKNYSNSKYFNISLAKLNFDLNSIQEPDNPIQGTLYPNPTNNSITLTFDVKTPIQLNYSIYNETGQLIKLLLYEFTNPGLITKSFDVSDLPTGTYFLRITGERFSQTYKVIINR